MVNPHTTHAESPFIYSHSFSPFRVLISSNALLTGVYPAFESASASPTRPILSASENGESFAATCWPNLAKRSAEYRVASAHI